MALLSDDELEANFALDDGFIKEGDDIYADLDDNDDNDDDDVVIVGMGGLTAPVARRLSGASPSAAATPTVEAPVLAPVRWRPP